jgi:hypothetical protein
MEIGDWSIAGLGISREEGQAMGGESNGEEAKRNFREGPFEENDIGQIGQCPQKVKKSGEFEKMDIHIELLKNGKLYVLRLG